MQNNNVEYTVNSLLGELLHAVQSNGAPDAGRGNVLTEAPSSNSIEEELRRLTGQLTLLQQANELSQQVLNDNTKALGQVAVNQSQGSGSGVASTAKTIGSLLMGGLGIGSLISGVASLFGGGDQPEPPPLVKYALPSALQYAGAVTASGAISSYDYNDRGGVRTIDASAAAPVPTNSTAGQQVIVQVNAMDSKSFLDHSDDIARAVRAAILNSSSLNDLISEM